MKNQESTMFSVWQGINICSVKTICRELYLATRGSNEIKKDVLMIT